MYFFSKSNMNLIDEKRQRTWAMYCHLSALLTFLAIPFANILGPLIIWSWKRSEMPILDEAGKKALNFQLSMTIYALIAGMLCFMFIGFLLLIPIILLEIIFVILATIKTSNGENFQYPISIRFLK